MKPILIVLIIFVSALLFTVYFLRLSSIVKDIKYVNMEISRTSGRAKAHWKKKKKRLKLMLIPIIGLLFSNKK